MNKHDVNLHVFTTNDDLHFYQDIHFKKIKFQGIFWRLTLLFLAHNFLYLLSLNN